MDDALGDARADTCGGRSKSLNKTTSVADDSRVSAGAGSEWVVTGGARGPQSC